MRERWVTWLRRTIEKLINICNIWTWKGTYFPSFTKMRGMFLLEFKPTEFVVESSLRHKSKKNGLLCVQKCLKNFIYLAVNFLIFSQNYLHIYVMLFWTKGRLTWSKIETFNLFFRDSATQMALCCAASGWLCLTRHDSPICIAFVCVANVCLSRKFGREQKGKMKREGEGETLGARAITRLETLVTQATLS